MGHVGVILTPHIYTYICISEVLKNCITINGKEREKSSILADQDMNPTSQFVLKCISIFFKRMGIIEKDSDEYKKTVRSSYLSIITDL